MKKMYLKKIIFLLLFVFVVVYKTQIAKADEGRNFEISIPWEQSVLLNERIEVYIVRDNMFFADIELNRANIYSYKTYLEKGSYKIFARVKYDREGLYKLSIKKDEFEINYSNLDKENTIEINIENAGLEEVDEHIEVDEEPVEVEEYNSENIDKLYEVQEEAKEEAQKSVAELEKWEEENSFLNTLANIYKTDISSSSHYYPDKEDNIYNGDNEEIKEYLKEQESVNDEDKVSVRKGENKERKKTIATIMLISLCIVIIVIVVIGFLIKKNEKERI